MSWGPNLLDMCFKFKVRLVNWPPGVPTPGVPSGLKSITGIPAATLRILCKNRVNFIYQEAADQKRQNADDDNNNMYMPNSDPGDDIDAVQKKRGSSSRVLEEDLLCFVPWTDGKSPLCVLFFSRLLNTRFQRKNCFL